MSFPQNNVGLPKAVDYEIPPSISDTASCRFVAITPTSNANTAVTNLPSAGTVFTTNSGGGACPSTSQMIPFDIPTGGSPSQFLDCTQTTLNFRLVYNVTTVYGGAGQQMNIISSLASFINSLAIYGGGQQLEYIANYDLLHHLLLNSTLNYSQRASNAFSFGADSNSHTGLDLPLAVGTYYFNACLPLVSGIIGVNASEKLLPIGLIQGGLQLQLTTPQNLPISTYCTTAPTTGASNMYLDSFSLTLKMIDLGDTAGSVIMSNAPNGKIFLKSSSYVNSNVSIPAGSSGSASWMLGIRNTSIKSLYAMIGSNALPAFCPSFLYDSVNPGISSLQLSIPTTGTRVPTRPLQPTTRPSECFTSFSQAFGSGPANSYMGLVTQENYCVAYPDKVAGWDTRFVNVGAGIRTPYTGNDNNTFSNVQKFLNEFYIGFDLERCSGSLFSGVNAKSCSPQLDVTLSPSAPIATLQLTTFALIDIVVSIDLETKSIMVYN